MEKEEDNLLYSFYILQSCDILHLFFKKNNSFWFWWCLHHWDRCMPMWTIDWGKEGWVMEGSGWDNSLCFFSSCLWGKWEEERRGSLPAAQHLTTRERGIATRCHPRVPVWSMSWGYCLSGSNSSEMLLISLLQSWGNSSKLCLRTVYLRVSICLHTYCQRLTGRVVQFALPYVVLNIPIGLRDRLSCSPWASGHAIRCTGSATVAVFIPEKLNYTKKGPY